VRITWHGDPPVRAPHPAVAVVGSFCYSEDRPTAYCGEEERQVLQWEALTGAERGELWGAHGGALKALAARVLKSSEWEAVENDREFKLTEKVYARLEARVRAAFDEVAAGVKGGAEVAAVQRVAAAVAGERERVCEALASVATAARERVYGLACRQQLAWIEFAGLVECALYRDAE
jgi:hypothetical protein